MLWLWCRGRKWEMVLIFFAHRFCLFIDFCSNCIGTSFNRRLNKLRLTSQIAIKPNASDLRGEFGFLFFLVTFIVLTNNSSLYLHRSKLTFVPLNIVRFKNLQMCVVVFYVFVCCLSSGFDLFRLHLSNNQLTNVPECIGDLKKLQTWAEDDFFFFFFFFFEFFNFWIF